MITCPLARNCSLVVVALLGWTGSSTLRADLVGHWKFDEGSGTTYADSSPNGNDAGPPDQPGGGDPWSSDVPPTGFANTGALEFDGATNYVSTPFAGIAGNAPRTVAFWIKTSVISSNQHGLVAWGVSTTNTAKWHLRLNNNAGNGPLGAIRTESQGDYTIGTTPLNDGSWHHVASVYPDGGGELGTVIHYVNGVAETPGGNNVSTQVVDTSTAGDPVTIGRRSQGANQNYFPGLMDDVRIYDRALSAQEVNDLMGATPPTDGLVFYTPFEEGTGTTIDDLGTGDNDGTLVVTPPPPVVLPTWSTDAPPHLSHSLLFADNDDLLYTEYPGIAGTASRSVAFWFKTTSAADNGILAWGNSGGNGLKWHARLNSTENDGPVGALRLEIQGGRTVATTPVADGEWHHAAIVFEEDADPDIEDVVFYLDGEIDPVNLLTSVPIDTQVAPAPGAFPVTLGGRDQTGTIRGFLGNLADMRIYDHALTQSEVQSVMTGTSPAPPLQLEITRTGADLSISWDSEDGLLYTLRSETDPSATAPIDWPPFGANESLAATPPRNTLTFPLPAESARYFVVESFPPPPVPIYNEDFETDEGGWTSGPLPAGTTAWEFGTPTVVGPSGAFSGTNCFGTDLDDHYVINTSIWLRSPAINLTTATAAFLNYRQFRSIEVVFDDGEVAVLDAADNTELALVETGIEGSSVDWEAVSLPVPAAALGKMVIFEFRLVTDGFDDADYAGWYIDDVEVAIRQ